MLSLLGFTTPIYAWTPVIVPFTDVPLIEADRVDFEYYKINGLRDPYAPQYDELWDYRAALRWDLTILKYGYMLNDTHTEGLKDGRVKTVGWQWELGLHLTDNIDIFEFHHSRHIFDVNAKQRDGSDLPGKGKNFPVENSWGLRVTLYKKDSK